MTISDELDRTLREGAALRRLERGVLEAAGPDRQKFLQSMLSNEVLALRPGDGRPGALLDVKGHVQALLRVLVTKDAVHLEMAGDRLEPVKQTLDHYKVAAPVRFQVKATAVFALFGPQAEAVLARAGGEAPADAAEAHRDTALDGRAVRVVRAGDLPAKGLVLHVAETDAEAVRLRLIAEGASEAAADGIDTLRVEKGRPWYGRDVTEANLLHETGLVAECCSFQKGCYLGQEVIARLDARGGNVNKRLRGLRLQAEARDGAALTAAGQEVGRVTTAARSRRLGPIALAYVHRSHAESGAVVEVDGRPATVVDLPMDDTPEDGMKIYTKTGDDGSTSLLGGTRVPKDHLRVAAYGDVDELNALLGVVKATATDGALRALLGRIQRDLFALGAQLADPTSKVANRKAKAVIRLSQTRRLEKAIDAAEAGLPPLTSFILPGGTALGAHLHMARTVCRRAERAVVTLHRDTPLDPRLLEYLNRLSDLLFVLARAANHRAGRGEDRW